MDTYYLVIDTHSLRGRAHSKFLLEQRQHLIFETREVRRFVIRMVTDPDPQVHEVAVDVLRELDGV